MSGRARIGAAIAKTIGRALGMGRSGARVAGSTFRHMAGRAPGQRIGVGGVTRALVAPRYPGLHAPIGVNPASRAFGRSRQMLGHTLRAGNVLATGGSAAAVGEHLYRELPQGLAGAALTDSYSGGPAETAYAKELRGLYPHYLMQATGISKPKSQYDKIVTDAITRTIVPQARYNMQATRRANPKTWGAIDALRSLSPVGAAITAGARLGGTEVPPDYEKLMVRPVLKSMATLGHDPGASPYHGPIMRGVAGHAAWRTRLNVARPAANEIQKAMQTPLGKAIAPDWAKSLVSTLPRVWQRTDRTKEISPAVRVKTTPTVEKTIRERYPDWSDSSVADYLDFVYSDKDLGRRGGNFDGNDFEAWPGSVPSIDMGWVRDVRDWLYAGSGGAKSIHHGRSGQSSYFDQNPSPTTRVPGGWNLPPSASLQQNIARDKYLREVYAGQ